MDLTCDHWTVLAPRIDLPDRHPSYQTCHRRLQVWATCGTLDGVLLALARDLEGRGGLNLSECFIGGSFAAGKKRGGRASSARNALIRAIFTLEPRPSIDPTTLQARSSL